MKGILAIVLTLLGSFCFAQQQKASFGIGTTGIGVAYEHQVQKQFSIGSSVNYLLIKGTTVNYVLDNFVKTDYNLDKTLSNFIEFVRENDYKKNFELILRIYGQNINLMSPLDSVSVL